MDTEDWRNLPDEDVEEMKKCLEEYRSLKAKGAHSQGRAHSQDVSATCLHVAETVCLSAIITIPEAYPCQAY
jgi:hypothetical protein